MTRKLNSRQKTIQSKSVSIEAETEKKSKTSAAANGDRTETIASACNFRIGDCGILFSASLIKKCSLPCGVQIGGNE